MSTDTFFTLTEYKRNYGRLKDEFVNAYEDNDDDEFIFLQIEHYKKCIQNTILEFGFFADGFGWNTKAMIAGEGIIWQVSDRIRDGNGEINKGLAENLHVSFRKIIQFLENQKKNKVKASPITTTQWALYYYILHEKKLVPRFKEKVKEIEELAKLKDFSAKNFQMKYNEFLKTDGKKSYSPEDVSVVNQMLKENYPSAVEYLNKTTQHIF